MLQESEDITRILATFSAGDDAARERLLPIVYAELKRIAAAQLRRERTENSLQPTALVHEAYLKLIGMTRIEWKDRVHFFAFSSRLMRQILVDKARHDRAEKRGGGAYAVDAELELAAPSRPVDVIALDDALEELAKLDERKARVVEMRFFAGLSEEEIGAVLEISPRTVKRDWQFARAWLFEALSA
jgi:RNA polymerase sigma factor (TIGR02999 family)